MDNILWQGKYLKIVKRDNWEFVERTGTNSAAIIIPLLVGDDGSHNIVLIKEWRIPLQKFIIGIPAGLIGDEGEELSIDAAKRELVEETGYKANSIKLVCSGPASSGLSNEILYFYLAYNLVKIDDGGGINDEEIEINIVNLNDVDKFLEVCVSNDIVVDPKIFIGLHFINKHISEL